MHTPIELSHLSLARSPAQINYSLEVQDRQLPTSSTGVSFPQYYGVYSSRLGKMNDVTPDTVLPSSLAILMFLLLMKKQDFDISDK